MDYRTLGIHHITAITSDPQKNLDFYEGFLGQRLIKKTVNFDDPSAYHLYYADAIGTPGTVLTFFYWAGIPKREKGSGEVGSIYYSISEDSIQYWRDRIVSFNVPFSEEVLPFGEKVLKVSDPDGLEIGLVATNVKNSIQPWEDGPVPKDHVLNGFYGALLHLPGHEDINDILENGLGYEKIATTNEITRYQALSWPGRYIATKITPKLPPARQGAGSVHHIAFQASDDTMLQALQFQVGAVGYQTTPLIDRFYFHASYFMTPANILFELSTNDIGFIIDESVAELGEHLQLPPKFEPYRNQIEASIIPLSLPRYKNNSY
jgi:glyoxalase family protein